MHADRRTNSHDEANSWFPKFCEKRLKIYLAATGIRTQDGPARNLDIIPTTRNGCLNVADTEKHLCPDGNEILIFDSSRRTDFPTFPHY